jgi:hypothetical protein
MSKSLLGCTVLLVLGGICLQSAHASSREELQQEKEQLLKENAELREIIRIQRENAALRGQARRAVPAVSAAQAASPSSVSPPKLAMPAVPSAAPTPAATRAAVEALRSPQANGWYAADIPLKAMPGRPGSMTDHPMRASTSVETAPAAPDRRHLCYACAPVRWR